MVSKTERRRLNRLLKSLDREDRDRLIDYAKRLSDGGTEETSKDANSGVWTTADEKRHENRSSHVPSYTEASKSD